LPHLYRRAFAAAVLCLCTLPVSGLDVFVNGKLEQRDLFAAVPWDPAEYRLPEEGPGTGPVEGAEKRVVRGYSLGAAPPLFASAYKIEVVSASGRQVIEDERLGDLLFEGVLVPGERGTELYIAGRHFRGVEEIDVYGEPVESGTVTVWLSWEGVDRLREELERFGRHHAIDIEVEEIPSSETKLTATLRGGGSMPELVMLQSSSLAQLVSARALQRLDYLDLGYSGEKGRGAFRLDGSSWAAPIYSDVQLLFYNPELVPGSPQAGWSFEEFETLARKAGERDGVETPAAWNAYSAYWLSPWLFAFGKETLVEPDGRIAVDGEPTRRAMEYLLSLRERGLLRVTERSAMISDFAAGRTAMILTGSYSIPHFRRLGIPFKPVPLPVNREKGRETGQKTGQETGRETGQETGRETGQETGRAAAPFIDYKGLAIPRRSRRPILARRVLQFLTGAGVQQRFSAAVHKLPARRGAWPAVRDEIEYFEVLEAAYRQGVTVPPQRAYGVYKNTMWKLLRFAFSGKMSVREVLSTGQRIIDNKLRQSQ